MSMNRIIKPLEIDQHFLKTISENFGSTSIEADQFFVAYNAVITLAYQPFSITLLKIKSLIETSLGEQLTEENFSSKWPKTTLGCLKRKIILTCEQVKLLRFICQTYSEKIHSLLAFPR